MVQGYGNVGSWAARILQELGASLIGVSDASGAVRADGGLDAAELADHLREGGSLDDFGDAEPIEPEELLDIECELFIPAALGGMVHEQNADRLSCKVMVEGANSPTTPAADRILQDKGVYIVPDLMANAGGVVVSYFEWVQNLQHLRWDEEDVNGRLERIMRQAFREVSERAEAEEVSLRDAAFEQGIERVVEAATTRGYIS